MKSRNTSRRAALGGADRAALQPLPGAGGSVRVGACGLMTARPQFLSISAATNFVLGGWNALVCGHHGAQAFLLLDEVRSLSADLTRR